jgi:hypothetical protein
MKSEDNMIGYLNFSVESLHPPKPNAYDELI